MFNDKADEVIEELFESFFKRYQTGLETSMRINNFIFDCVHLLYCKCHKINFDCADSYIDSLDWMKIKTTAINPINKKDNKYFQYNVTVALHHEEIKKDPQRITEIQPFINKSNCEGVNCLSAKDDLKNYEKNNLKIALNVFYAKKEKKIPPMFQNIIQIFKMSYSFDDSKRRRIASSCSIIKRVNFEKQWYLLLFKLSSFL